MFILFSAGPDGLHQGAGCGHGSRGGKHTGSCSGIVSNLAGAGKAFGSGGAFAFGARGALTFGGGPGGGALTGIGGISDRSVRVGTS